MSKVVTTQTTTFLHKKVSPAVVRGDGPGLAGLQLRLQQAVDSAGDHGQAAAHLADAAMELTNARVISFYQFDRSGNSTVLAERYSGGGQVNPELRQLSVELAKEATATSKAQLKALHDQRLIAVPVASPPGQAQAIVGLLAFRSGVIEPFVVSLQLIAASATHFWNNQRTRTVDEEARIASGVIEIIGQMQRGEDRKAAAIVMVNQLTRLLDCQRVSLGWSRDGEQQIELAAVSDLSHVDSSSDTARQIVAAMNEAAGTGRLCMWPPSQPAQRASAMMQQRLSAVHDNQTVMSAPLIAPDGQMIAAINILAKPGFDTIQLHHAVQAALPHLASALQVAMRLDSPYRRWKRKLTGEKAIARWKKVAIACGLFVACMLVPMPHRVACDCEVYPEMRRFVVAPHNGLLKETLVDPGDLVDEGTLLAKLDEREIEWELNALTAERDRAAKERDKQMAEQNVTGMQMADLEVRRLNLKIGLLNHQRSNLEIRSQEAGVVLRGDLENVVGAPVEKGQTLFEIAPVERMTLNIRIPQHELPYVEEDARVKLRLDALPGQVLHANVAIIYPQSEVIDEANVFVAEAELSTDNQSLRPGMQGVARVNSGWKPVGWILFHRPWQKFMNWLR